MSQQIEIKRVKLFADGANKNEILGFAGNPMIQGFTTNPTLMRKAGIADYAEFARDVLVEIKDKPISFEVFADDLEEMKRQALKIATWGKNVYVKIPVTNTEGLSTAPLIRDLTRQNVKLNVTAIFTPQQTAQVCEALRGGAPAVVSVFAGRIADSGRDPVPYMKSALEICRATGPDVELLWASPREFLNVVQADAIGVDIITATSDILAKLSSLNKELVEFSLDTVKMFRNDAVKAGYSL